MWELWKMAAVMKMMPDMLVSEAELLWDDIEVVGKGSYERLKEKLVMWAGTEVEKKTNGGPVQMEVDEVRKEGSEDWEADWWNCEVTTAAE
jgi:hypothetical protein